MVQENPHEFWMQQALALARRAELQGEVPVGAILVLDNKVIGKGWNRPIGDNDPCAHAEIVALREGAHYLNNYRLLNTTLYVTLEPCVMCAGAIVHARVNKVVFGASDHRAGAIQSVFNIFDNEKLNHRVLYEGGVDAEASRRLLQDFFKQRRKKSSERD